MPNFTKKAIRESFIKLLNERPLGQITVKDVVEDCGVNRNTFYYHYEDIPALLQEIIMEEANSIIRDYPTIDSVENCLTFALQFALKNKKAILHIYNSINRSIFEHYLMNVCEYVTTTYIDTLLSGQPIRESDKELIIRLYKCEFFGIAMEWMNHGMKEQILADFNRLCTLRKGMVEELISRSRKSS